MLCFTLLRLALSDSSCSQTLKTVHCCPLRSVSISLDRSTFRLILRSQYGRFVFGSVCRQYGHPCQKQPSMNTAIRNLSKTTSGLPGTSLAFFRQPLNLKPASMEKRRLSNPVPLLLTACIVRRRSSGVRLSCIRHVVQGLRDIRGGRSTGPRRAFRSILWPAHTLHPQML